MDLPAHLVLYLQDHSSETLAVQPELAYAIVSIILLFKEWNSFKLYFVPPLVLIVSTLINWIPTSRLQQGFLLALFIMEI